MEKYSIIMYKKFYGGLFHETANIVGASSRIGRELSKIQRT
jgi:antirestriction protein ArdC